MTNMLHENESGAISVGVWQNVAEGGGMERSAAAV